jgi:hypothetical protein
MNIKTILSLSALAGALATASVASAEDRWDRSDRSSSYDRYHHRDLDVIDSASLRARRGTVEFTFTSGQRRDGLQLYTDARQLTILSIELEYSDGRITRLGRRTVTDGLLTIQRGRPPGLRKVRVKYTTARNDRRATLALVQIHDGDGYTSEADQRDDERGTYRSYPRQDDYDRGRDGYWVRDRDGGYRWRD